jgi:hypothetical protein
MQQASESVIGRALLRWLGMNWKKVEAVLGYAEPGPLLRAANGPGPRGGAKYSPTDIARLAHARAVIGNEVLSFNDLTVDEARRLQAAYLSVL